MQVNFDNWLFKLKFEISFGEPKNSQFYIVSYPDGKGITCIKLVRSHLGWTLRDAKNAVMPDSLGDKVAINGDPAVIKTLITDLMREGCTLRVF